MRSRLRQWMDDLVFYYLVAVLIAHINTLDDIQYRRFMTRLKNTLETP